MKTRQRLILNWLFNRFCTGIIHIFKLYNYIIYSYTFDYVAHVKLAFESGYLPECLGLRLLGNKYDINSFRFYYEAAYDHH